MVSKENKGMLQVNLFSRENKCIFCVNVNALTSTTEVEVRISRRQPEVTTEPTLKEVNVAINILSAICRFIFELD